MSSSRIQSNTRSHLKGAWLFATLWNLASAPIIFLVPRELERNPAAAVGFLFPAVGVGLLVWAVRTTLRWRRFGPSWFEMPLPASPGGHCSGSIHTRLARPPIGEERISVTLKLTCVKRVVTGSGKNRNTTETILWREEHEVLPERLAFTPIGTAIPVHFALPADALETTAIDRSSILWVLAADAELPGVDFSEEFHVPVHRTEASAEAPSVFAATSAAVPTKPVTLEDLARAGIHVRPTADGTEYYFAAARNPSFAAGATAFLLFWSGAIWLQIVLGAPWIFPVVFGVFELVLGLIVADLWLGSTTVTVGGGVVRRRHGFLRRGTTRVIPSSSIARLELHISMQTSGRGGTPYYSLRATLASGKRRSFGDGIRHKRQAEWLLGQMRSAIGLKA